MSRLIFAALASFVFSGASAAQSVPGRDLLEFPIGTLAEAPALSAQMAGGFWNPASAALQGGARGQWGFAGLTTPQEQGVRMELLGGAYRVRPTLTASLSIAQASVSDILQTETDPQSIGPEISYGTTLVSGGAIVQRGVLALGVAARYRRASVDNEHAGAFSTDVGAVLDGIGREGARVPLRLAVSTFLFSPSRSREKATYLAAADLPVFHPDSDIVIRAGLSTSRTESRGHDDYVFATSRFHQLDVSAGMLATSAFGNANRRWRLGFGLHYAGYTAAIGREDGAAGIGASYQFLLTRTIR